ncbi:MAG: DUF4349 domain-containing protein [Dehalococcoidia bacterium]
MESRKHRLRLLAAAVGVVALVGVLGACGASDDDDDEAFSGGAALTSSESAGRDADAPAATGAASAAAAAAVKGDPAAPATGGGALAVNPLDRKIIFNASLALGVQDVDAAFTAVNNVAKIYGGFVERSSFTGGGETDPKRRSASITLRVPTEGYNDALGSLRTIPGAKVQTETAKSTEVTEQYTDLQSRLRNLERTEAQYLTLLGQAKTVQDILTMTDRLDAVRGQIEQVQGRLKVLDHLTSLASIDVTLAPLAPAKVEKPAQDGPKAFGEAFADAWDWSLETARYVGVVVASIAAVGIWLILPLGLIAAGVRFAGRRHTAKAS